MGAKVDKFSSDALDEMLAPAELALEGRLCAANRGNVILAVNPGTSQQRNQGVYCLSAGTSISPAPLEVWRFGHALDRAQLARRDVTFSPRLRHSYHSNDRPAVLVK
jgi:hypothetical protein